MNNDIKEIQDQEIKNNQVEVKSFEEALKTESWHSPIADIFEDKENYFLAVQMPGVSKENVKVTVDNGNLILMGRINYDEKENQNYILQESFVANYYRKFKLSDSVDVEKIDAKMVNGILTLTLPKHERIKERKIQIK